MTSGSERLPRGRWCAHGTFSALNSAAPRRYHRSTDDQTTTKCTSMLLRVAFERVHAW